MNRSVWQRLLREPLLHFLLLGAAIFALYALSSSSRAPASGSIIVSAGQIENMASIFARTRMRPPTGPELKALIDDYVREEIYSREAIAQGLDRGDPVIKRRLRQKMEYVVEDIAADIQPTDAQLQTYLDTNTSKFSVDAEISFRQIYFSPEKRGATTARDAAGLLEKLNGGTGKIDPDAMGDRLSMIEPAYTSLPLRDASRLFGEGFASSLDKAGQGKWTGPIESGYGLHLIYVERRTESRLPPLSEIRDAVLRDWHTERALRAREDYFTQMQVRYNIVIEPFPATGKPADR